ncbi:hypothetical protein, variant [Capsaspora owczarzaki ATCC 30864]|nr:hypothetical protein, variant [Capsaspora owczarzaki ATCC 30864]
MEEHINGGCATPAATATKIFANACSFQNCKTKEAMPMRCATCRKNYCLKHRIEQDHQCSAQAGASQQRNQGSGPFRSTPAQPAASRTTPAPSAAKSNTRPQQGAMNTTGRQLAEERSLRQTNAPSNRAPASAVHANGGLSEDEALARALAESARISSSSGPTSNAPDGSNLSEEDIELQRAMQQSLAEQQRRRQQQQQQQQQQQASNSESGCCVS